MSIKLGSTTIGSVYLGSTKMQVWQGITPVKVGMPAISPKTMRINFYDDFDPTTEEGMSGHELWTHVAGHVYDFHYDSPDWYVRKGGSNYASVFNLCKIGALSYPIAAHQLDVLDADLTGVTSAPFLFQGARMVHRYKLRHTSSLTTARSMFYHQNGMEYLEEITLFDTSAVTDFRSMFEKVSTRWPSTKSVSIPLFDTSSAVNVSTMFAGFNRVSSGALALYQQMSTQSTPPTTYTNCFTNCGRSTVTGKAELAQIPKSWGGTMA